MADFDHNLIKPSRRRGRTWFYLLGLVAILLVGAYVFLLSKINTPLSADTTTQQFVVVVGESSENIANRLYAQGLISSPWVFNFYGHLSGGSRRIKSGEYSFAPSMSMRQIMHALDMGKASTNILRIKEGASIDDIADYLDSNSIVGKDDFYSAVSDAAKSFDYFGEQPRQKSLEGYLFPDTYFVKRGASAASIIQKMLDNESQKISPQIRQGIYAQHKTIYDILTLASIIEKEVGRNTATLSQSDLQTLDQERKTVAGVFYNRLKKGMPLESDATITYITKKKNPEASTNDLQIDSPYNTYKYPGLPPGPISNPSLSSILAAVYPMQTDYLYFLTKPDGTAVFAKTLDEQNANKQKYLK